MARRVESVRPIVAKAPNSAWEAKGLNLVRDSDFFFVLYSCHNEIFIHVIYEKLSTHVTSFDWKVRTKRKGCVIK